jgi:hypothetical protein
MKIFWRHKLNPNETIPNIIFPNLKFPNWTINQRKYPERNIPEFFGNITKLGEGEKLSKVRGKGTKLGEGCPKVRLSQDRMPILGEGERD